MRRYLPQSSASAQGPRCSSVSPYCFPPPSLFFRVSKRSAAKEEAGEAAEKESSSKELCAETPAEDLHLLMDLDSLVAAAAAAAANGCGSLKHCSSKQGHAAAPSGPRAAAADCAGVSPGNKEEIQFAPSAAGVGTAAAAAAAAARVPPRCIQLLSLRYRHEVEMEAAVFQQLLHLFMDYIVQCRKAYEQQRRQRSASGEAPAPLSLETPEFCDFGPQLKLRQMEGGGIIIEFLSLVAVHNGRDRLQMQWAETVGLHSRLSCLKSPQKLTCGLTFAFASTCSLPASICCEVHFAGRAAKWGCVGLC